MTDPRAVDVPEFRAELIDYMNGLGVQVFQILKDMGLFAVPHLSAKQLAANEAQRLAGDLYFVGADMVELAKHAVKTLPDFKIDAEDLPSKSGFIVFEKPIGTVRQEDLNPDDPREYSIAAASWSHWKPGPRANPGMWISWYSDQRSLDEPMPNWPTRYVFDHEHLVPFAVEGTQFLDVFVGKAIGTPELLDILRATWLLMQQPIARTTEVETYRAARRRLERLGHEPKAVRVIQLRRTVRPGPPGESDREYHHQWIVRGHWRQQWYPSREVHRPVWIAPHVKGPEGAPLLGGEKVHAWVR